MNDHRDDSFLDKAKDAVGMDTDEDTTADETSTDRPSGWAGVDDALGGAGREAGSVYEAEEADDDTIRTTDRP
jgi:hypothetical protein